MATPLPYEGRVQLPVEWSGTIHKVEMRSGSGVMSTTIGAKPNEEIATITWAAKSAADANAILSEFMPHFSGTYTYTCPVRGQVKLQPTTSYGINEHHATYSNGKPRVTFVSVEFRRV